MSLKSDGTIETDSATEYFVQCIAEKAMYQDRFLLIDFVTVQDYLQGLEQLSKISAESDIKTVFYLAAAVSDFYIPPDRMAEHKI